MSISWIKEEEKHILNVLPILLRKDVQFKETLYEVLNETFTKKDDFAKVTMRTKEIEEEQNKIQVRLIKVEAEVKKMAEQQKKSDEKLILLEAAIAKLVEEQKRTAIKVAELAKAQKRTENKAEELAETQKRIEVAIKNLAVVLAGIDAAWGSFAREEISDEMGFKTVNFKVRDEEGIVWGYPAEVEIEIGIQNGKIFIREIKSSINNSDVYIFN